jgi:hypothetical protein
LGCGPLREVDPTPRIGQLGVDPAPVYGDTIEGLVNKGAVVGGRA